MRCVYFTNYCLHIPSKPREGIFYVIVSFQKYNINARIVYNGQFIRIGYII